jgi:WD40 repeat protein
MSAPDSLHLDEHLARLLAAYDQGLGEADGTARTLDVQIGPNGHPIIPEKPLGPPNGQPHELSGTDLLPDPDRTHGYAEPHPPAATPAPSGSTQHRVGRFELRRQLGKGGCGIVFLAFDPKLHREVALKIPRPEMLLSQDARRRLIREALAAAEFDHPNLVPVYETGEIGPVCFIATAFCPGATLAEWLDRQAYPVPVRQAARLVAQLAEAVQHAHDRGVLHRDLKPNNVILQVVKADPNAEGPPPGSCPLRGDHFVPRVVDFGLAKLGDRGPSETGSRQILGTPKYMAPEQAQAKHDDIGPAADVYSLGVILYEMLAGKAPYDGATDVEVLRQAIEGDLTAPRGVRADIPRDLEAICLKAMARTPAKRYRTAIDLADDLRRFLEGKPTLARPLKWPGRAVRWLRRNDQVVALILVTGVAVFFLAIGLWSLSQTRRATTDRDTARAQLQEETRNAQRRAYARHVRDAFLAWRTGDARQMGDSLASARLAGDYVGDRPSFPWGYLSGVGRVDRATVRCPAGPVGCVAVSPDGTRVVTGHLDGTLAFWDRASGRPVGTVKAHAGAVTHVEFVVDGTGLVTAGGNSPARFWTVPPAGLPTAGPPLPPVPGSVTCLSASADGRRVLIGSATGHAVCCDAATGQSVVGWKAADEPVEAVALAPDGGTLATVTKSGVVRMWAGADAAPRTEVRAAAGSGSVVFIPSAGGGWLLAAAGREDGTVRLCDRDGRELHALAGHAEPILTMSASPDGSLLATGGMDECVCVWDVATGTLRSMLRGHEKAVRGIGFAGPRELVTGADDGLLKTWDLAADPEGPAARDLAAAVTAVGGSADGHSYAIGYGDGSVEVYPRQGAEPRRVPGNGRGAVGLLRVPADGRPVGVELAGRAAVAWHFGDAPRVILRVEPAGGAVATVADLSADGSKLAVGDDRGRVTVWAVQDGTKLAEIDTKSGGPVRYLALSAEGTHVATPSEGGMVGVWAVGDAEARYRVHGHGDGLWLIRFMPGGDKLLTAGRGSAVKLWRLTGGKEELALLGHIGRVTSLTVSPDGRTLVSGSGTGDVKLWDLRTGQELVGLRRHNGPVTAAAFATGGRLLVTGGTTPGGRGELVYWEATP